MITDILITGGIGTRERKDSAELCLEIAETLIMVQLGKWWRHAFRLGASQDPFRPDDQISVGREMTRKSLGEYLYPKGIWDRRSHEAVEDWAKANARDITDLPMLSQETYLMQMSAG